MARFPLKEAEVVSLAEAMETGLTANAAIYPAPPVAPPLSMAAHRQLTR